MKLYQVEYVTEGNIRAMYYERARDFAEAAKYAIAGQRGGNGTLLAIRWIGDLVAFNVTVRYRYPCDSTIRLETTTIEGRSVRDAVNRVTQRVAAREYKTGIVVEDWNVTKAVDGSKVEGVVSE